MANILSQGSRKAETKTYFNFPSQTRDKQVSRSKQADKDSGVYESYSSSQRGSVCPSGCGLISPDSTTSSAYSSAVSTCSEHDHYRHRLANPTTHGINRVPFHHRLSPASPSTSRLCANSSTTSRVSCLDQVSRSASIKSDRSSADASRCLSDPSRGKVYEKKRLLGKGGFARVYEVSEVGQWSQPMAAKVIDKSRITRSVQREKVDLEIELFSEASGHPNIVTYMDTFEDENCIVILQELCNKKSLAQYLRRKQSLSEIEVCEIILQIISGLKHLHGKGIIHRDLKLGNILLTDDLKVKIGDFGLATRSETGQKRTVCGTPNFIAPEVLQRQGHGVESDIWALGCLLYTLLVGKPPFETACLRDTYRCILKNSYRIPVTVSPLAADLIQMMLRPVPSARPTLSEIASHPFFKKLSPISKQDRVSSSNNVSCQVKVNETASTQSADEKSILQTPTKTIESETVKKNLSRKTSTNKTKGAVKSLANLLQKKLVKISSPKKGAVNTVGKQQTEEKQLSDQEGSSNDKKPSETFVTKWVDYSNRYGFGYQLATGTICVLFNDGKHISYNPCTKIIKYAASEKAPTMRFGSDEVPTCLAKYASVLMSFTNYIGKSFSHCNDKKCEQVENEARLLTWCRTDKYMAMYFNNGTLQVNFSADHVKVSITSIHDKAAMRFTVVDQYRQSKTYNRTEFLSRDNVEMQYRMAAIHQQFHCFFDVQCNSHPFCDFCWQHGC